MTQRFYTKRKEVVGIRLDGTNWEEAVEFVENQCPQSMGILTRSRMKDNQPVSLAVTDKYIHESDFEYVGIGDWIVLDAHSKKAVTYTEAEWNENFEMEELTGE